jgi:hypothetical protein
MACLAVVSGNPADRIEVPADIASGWLWLLMGGTGVASAVSACCTVLATSSGDAMVRT